MLSTPPITQLAIYINIKINLTAEMSKPREVREVGFLQEVVLNAPEWSTFVVNIHALLCQLFKTPR